VGEIGSAHGMFLNWLRGHFPEADVHGTELTIPYRNVAFLEYGIKLEEEFDYSKKYDLIVSYHVLEHQCNPDEKLKKYAECLKDGGVFYLACPVWFRELANGANIPGFELDYYWAPDHINAWSEEHLEYIIAKAGLEIVYKNDNVYGNTYILKRSTKEAVKPEFDLARYEAFLDTAKKCYLLLSENKAQEAIALHKNMPSAWINHYEFNRAQFHKSREETDKYLKQSIAACPNSADTIQFASDILCRYERYDEALECLHKALERKPNHPTVLMAVANCYRMRALKETDPAKKKEMLLKCINIGRFIMTISTESVPQVLNWVYHDEALIPVD
jgi:tetratricopeptide (TPR) repeat protein